MFRESPRRAALLADVLQALLGLMSEAAADGLEKLQALYQAAQLGVLKFVLPQGPRTTQEQAEAEFLAKYAQLTFLRGTDVAAPTSA